MGYILVAPETVITWAFRQYYAAKDIASRNEGMSIDLCGLLNQLIFLETKDGLGHMDSS